ncbi:uncharacterized protein ASCRUDRAFT_70418 [Ascoidea rubescens DSM 1968]|uniref:Uncharacterized protein n=1 Tax=Ascoidea rubescens DSM 1968 TaxID=1344418 RepID=A0A1D2VHU3_9ASCO|nr:hypothetical protein ASCRUDRAFT_70418 [Ascoidea rubescens DSM 1968]ODV61216.1 hypothetical protein ASCRUDRAFT_70418 [Ascoidea rubescens DSM 1968]
MESSNNNKLYQLFNDKYNSDDNSHGNNYNNYDNYNNDHVPRNFPEHYLGNKSGSDLKSNDTDFSLLINVNGSTGYKANNTDCSSTSSLFSSAIDDCVCVSNPMGFCKHACDHSKCIEFRLKVLGINNHNYQQSLLSSSDQEVQSFEEQHFLEMELLQEEYWQYRQQQF